MGPFHRRGVDHRFVRQVVSVQHQPSHWLPMDIWEVECKIMEVKKYTAPYYDIDAKFRRCNRSGFYFNYKMLFDSCSNDSKLVKRRWFSGKGVFLFCCKAQIPDVSQRRLSWWLMVASCVIVSWPYFVKPLKFLLSSQKESWKFRTLLNIVYKLLHWLDKDAHKMNIQNFSIILYHFLSDFILFWRHILMS